MTTPIKLPCTCGFETDERCRIHPARPSHIMWALGTWVCHECVADLESMRLPHEAAVLKLLEKQFILCSGCAHDMAFIEDGAREADVFESTLLTRDKFLEASTRELEQFLSEETNL